MQTEKRMVIDALNEIDALTEDFSGDVTERMKKIQSLCAAALLCVKQLG